MRSPKARGTVDLLLRYDGDGRNGNCLDKDSCKWNLGGAGMTNNYEADQDGGRQSVELSLDLRYANSSDCEWFKTSDLGKEENGYWQVLHRVDRVINTGGKKVIPDFVEKNILEFPSVKSCFVSSSNDEKWGQKIVAYISPQSVDQKGLKEFLRTRLQNFEMPKEFYLSENLDAVKA